MIRFELGFPVLETAAEPWIGIAAIFKSVIQPYLSSGASTTCSTAVVAASTPTPVTLTLASATGFAPGATIVVDADIRQERVTCTSVSGSAITAMLSLAHSGTYQVTVEGGESIVRNILTDIRDVDVKMREARSRAGIKKVDEIEFYGNASGKSAALSALIEEREYLRSQLSRVLFGAGGLNGMYANHGGGRVEVY